MDKIGKPGSFEEVHFFPVSAPEFIYTVRTDIQFPVLCVCQIECNLSIYSLFLFFISITVAVCGFILLHASQVQPKNTSSVIIANLLSIGMCCYMNILSVEFNSM